MAPEIYMKKGYSYQVDIWSCGVILYSLIYLIHPFDDI